MNIFRKWQHMLIKEHNIKEWVDRLPGGLADKYSPESFDSEQLKNGIEIEMEHTNNLKLATEIAMDHLLEDPSYYIKLSKLKLEQLTSYTKKWKNIF